MCVYIFIVYVMYHIKGASFLSCYANFVQNDIWSTLIVYVLNVVNVNRISLLFINFIMFLKLEVGNNNNFLNKMPLIMMTVYKRFYTSFNKLPSKTDISFI